MIFWLVALAVGLVTFLVWATMAPNAQNNNSNNSNSNSNNNNTSTKKTSSSTPSKSGSGGVRQTHAERKQMLFEQARARFLAARSVQ